MLICHRITCFVLLSLVIVIAIARPHPSDAVECTAQIQFQRGIEDMMTGEFSATANLSEPYPRLREANVEVGFFGVRGYALCENTAPSTEQLYVPIAYGEFELSDVVFSSEGSGPVPVSLNLDLDGQFNLLDQAGTYALGTIDVEVTINGTTFPGEIHVCTMYCTEVQLGLLEGVMGRSYPNLRLTTPQVVVPVNQPVTVVISMLLTIGVDANPYARGEGVFNNSFSFAHAGPVFNVPAGINVNSEHGIITDNVYYMGNPVPVEPSSWGAIKALFR